MSWGGRVIVPLDGSVAAEAILPLLREVAAALDLELILLRVLEGAPAEVGEAARAAVSQQIAREDAGATSELGPIERDLHARRIRARVEIRRGDAAEQIVAAADEHRAAFIALSAHGRSGVKRELYGSVVEDVLRQASVPVVLLRMPDEEVVRLAARRASVEQAS